VIANFKRIDEKPKDNATLRQRTELLKTRVKIRPLCVVLRLCRFDVRAALNATKKFHRTDGETMSASWRIAREKKDQKKTEGVHAGRPGEKSVFDQLRP
jgi:hypothetical protein